MNRIRQSLYTLFAAGALAAAPTSATAGYIYASVGAGSSTNASSAYNFYKSGLGYRTAVVSDNSCDNWAAYGNFSKSGVVERLNNETGCRSSANKLLNKDVTAVQACVNIRFAPDPCTRFETK